MPHARPTIGDVARAAGVSKGTVSLAYSGKRPVAEETRRRIFAAAEALRWTASSSAKALATSRTSTIGLVIARRPEIIATDTFFPRFLAGCEAVLAEAGMGLMLNVVTDEDAETAAYERYAGGRVDGVILLDVERDDRRLDLVRELGLPAAMLSAEAPPADSPGDVPVVYTEDAAAVEELVDREIGEHVLSVGRHLRHRLTAMEHVVEVRGHGLMRGAQLVAPVAAEVVEEGLAEGLVMNRIGSSILRFLPPLVITRDEVDEACDRLEKILDRLA